MIAKKKRPDIIVLASRSKNMLRKTGVWVSAILFFAQAVMCDLPEEIEKYLDENIAQIDKLIEEGTVRDGNQLNKFSKAEAILVNTSDLIYRIHYDKYNNLLYNKFVQEYILFYSYITHDYKALNIYIEKMYPAGLPDDAVIYYFLGVSSFEHEWSMNNNSIDYKEALNYVNKSITLDPTLVEAYFLRSQIYGLKQLNKEQMADIEYVQGHIEDFSPRLHGYNKVLLENIKTGVKAVKIKK